MKSRRLKDVSRKLRMNSTDAERRMWSRLRDGRLGGIKFRRQLPLAGYVVDFCSAEYRLIIELDGGQHATEILKDEMRTKRLWEEGYRVIRFWDNDVLTNTEDVLQTIKNELQLHPHPSQVGSPSPLEGEGK